LQIYLVIDQHRVVVEMYERLYDKWQTQEFSGLDAIVPLPALGCDLPLAEIYAGVEI